MTLLHAYTASTESRRFIRINDTNLAGIRFTIVFKRDHFGKKGQFSPLQIPYLKLRRRAFLYQKMRDKLIEHKQYIQKYGQDLPEVAGWKWK